MSIHVRSISSEVHCRSRYFDIWASPPTKEIALSLAIILLTITIECVAHYDKVADPSPTDALDEPPRTDSVVAVDHDPPKSSGGTICWGNPNPSPSVRASRFIATTVLLTHLCIVFGFRIEATAPPDVPSDCLQYLDVEPNWWLVTIFSIIPFIVGCIAWLRTLVDCLLVRWGKTVGYPTIDRVIGWPPCAPIFFCLVFLFVLPIGFLRKAVLCLMGGRDVEGKNRVYDIELGDGEQRGLIDGIDGDGEEDAPPAYDQSWRDGRI